MKRFLISLACFLLVSVGWVNAQSRSISGKVVFAESGETVIGATVRIDGTSTGTATDANGAFSLNVPENAKTITVSYVGMIPVTAPIQNNVTIRLESAAQTLSEVVVVAYGQQRREAITGAVASIKADVIERRPISSATSALEGLALGVQVNNTYGEPGSVATIRIRGFNSINGSNAPLTVIDGVPMSGSVSDLNSADIETITILKDASSAALYGNRAANGVVLITTKRGRMGDDNTKVSLNISQGFYQRGTKDFDLLNTKEYMEAVWMGRRNALYTDDTAGKYSTWSDANPEVTTAVADILGYNIFNKSWSEMYDANGKLSSGTEILRGYRDDLDWYKSIERTGIRSDYTLNVRGGSKKSAYYTSLGYLKEDGFTKASGMERLTATTRIDVTPTEWFKTGVSLTGANTVTNSMTGSPTDNATSFINPFYFVRHIAPIYPVHLHDENTGEYILDEFGKKQYDGGASRPQAANRHIAWETELNKNRRNRTALNGIVYADISFLNDFVFTLKGNMETNNYTTKTYTNAIIGDAAGVGGRMTLTTYRYKSYTTQQLLNWNRTFNEVHNVEALLGHEYNYYNFDYSYLNKTDEKFPNVMELTNFNVNSSSSGYQAGDNTEGYIGRASYNYDHKYYAEASFRRDGSSRFYKDNRWGNFWSLGGSWTLSNEDFIQDINFIDYLKFRVAYGEVGSDRALLSNGSANYYPWMALYASTTNGGDGAVYKSQNEAREITWETSQSFSVGFESRLFNRANFSVEFFNKVSKDLLFDLTMPASMGILNPTTTRPTVVKNFGSAANYGVEIGFDVDVVRTNGFKWNLGANINAYKNEIKSLPDDYGNEGYISGSYRRIEGRSIYEFWLYQFAGIDREDGRSLYLLNDDSYYIPVAGYTGAGAMTDKEERTAMAAANYKIIDGEAYVYNTTYGKRDWSGSPIPTMFGSITNRFSYEGFELSTLLTYSFGGKIMNSAYQSLMTLSATPSALHKDVLKAWTPEDIGTGIDPNGIPALNTSLSSLNNSMSTRFLVDGRYVNIKNVTLSYNFPKKTISKASLDGLLLNVSVENLALFTKQRGLDPQQQFRGIFDNGFPPSRVMTLGLSINF